MVNAKSLINLEKLRNIKNHKELLKGESESIEDLIGIEIDIKPLKKTIVENYESTLG